MTSVKGAKFLNYSTEVAASKTAGEIQAILVAHGASAITTVYGDGGTIQAISFTVRTPGGEVVIRLPIDREATLRVLRRLWNEGKIPHRYADPAQAERVAWRVVKDWVAAQMALVETEQVRMEQIFLPYLLTPQGQTIYEVAVQSGFLALPEGKAKELSNA